MNIEDLRVGDLIIVTKKEDSLNGCVGKIVLINGAVLSPHIEAYFNEDGEEFTSLLLLNDFIKMGGQK